RRSDESRVRHHRQVRPQSGRTLSHRKAGGLIIYRKASALRIQRMPVPEPPYWAATTIAPYSARRGSPVSIDYLELRASFSERLEVAVCEDVAQELQRVSERHAIVEPALIEASEFAEAIFRRGEDALRF